MCMGPNLIPSASQLLKRLRPHTVLSERSVLRIASTFATRIPQTARTVSANFILSISTCSSVAFINWASRRSQGQWWAWTEWWAVALAFPCCKTRTEALQSDPVTKRELSPIKSCIYRRLVGGKKHSIEDKIGNLRWQLKRISLF